MSPGVLGKTPKVPSIAITDDLLIKGE